MNVYTSLWACLAGFLLDLLLGDPQWFRFHPIRLIGGCIAFLESTTRKIFSKNKWGEFFAGFVLVLLVVGISTGVPFLMLRFFYFLHPAAGLCMEAVFCYFLFAAKSLKDESMKVYEALEQEGLEAGRKAVSRIVGRDTQKLDEAGVTRAAVETIAENTSDGVIAPMFYMLLGGAVGGFFYKAVNTMDSMVAYKNETYFYFGKAAARMDDICNFIPARISAFFMLLASFLDPAFDGRLAFRIFLRDRSKSASPNSTQTESVCAGALRMELLGDAWYFGKLYHKETIGEPLEPAKTRKIRDANRLLYETAVLAMAAGGMLKYIFIS